ncbi:MAG: serine hydrolase domain-containing protein, partial [Bacteroidota bacterium]
MKNITLIFALLISQFAFGQWADTEKQQYSKNAQIILNQAIELRDFVGVTSGVAQNGQLIWKGGAGWNNRKNSIPADGNMLHRTASITKPMTAVAILQLVEKGKIDLDVPIQTYLPEFPKKSEGDITTRHLLQNTSGIKPYKNQREGTPKKHYPTLLDAIATFQDRALAFEPGTDYLYTTYGYVVLGAIIEKVSGQTYHDYMQENIWSKANMKHTSLEIKGNEYPNKAELYHKLKGKF